MLIELDLQKNQLSNLTPLSNLTSLTGLNLGRNPISDLTPLSNLSTLPLMHNQISDILPLVENQGLGEGDTLDLRDNPLSATSVDVYIPLLQQRGVNVIWDPVPTPTKGPSIEPTPASP